MSLNYDDKGIPIAIQFYTERSKKNRLISLNESAPKGLDEDMITHEHLELYYGKEAVKRKASADRKRKELIEEIKEKNVLRDEVRADSKSKFNAIPDITKERTVWFLSGPSGSGKSFYSASLLDTWRKFGIKRVFIITTQEDPKFGKAEYVNINKIVIPSKKDNDFVEQMDAYLKAKMKFKIRKKEMMKDQVDLDDVIDLELEIDKMKPNKGKNVTSFQLYNLKKFEKDYGNSVWLFDDYENMDEATVQKVKFLRNHILTTGRHYNANMIICNHLTNFGGDSRLIMAETHYFVLFNRGTARSKKYFLQNYLDMDKQQIKRVLKSLNNSRSVTICPDKRYCLYEKLIYLYD